MFSISLNALCWTLLIATNALGLDWTQSLVVSQVNGGSQVLQFGVGENGTAGIGKALDEVEQPPMPSLGIGEARFISPKLGNGTLLDIRPWGGQHLLTISFQRGNGGAVILSWDASELNRLTTAATLQDPFTDGSLIQVDMRRNNYPEIENVAIDTINLLFTQTEKNDAQTTAIKNRSWGSLRQKIALRQRSLR